MAGCYSESTTTITPTLTKTSQPCDVLRSSARHRAHDSYTKLIPKMSVGRILPSYKVSKPAGTNNTFRKYYGTT